MVLPEQKNKPQETPRQDPPCQEPRRDVDDLIFSSEDKPAVSQR